jgi:hypothetical protein
MPSEPLPAQGGAIKPKGPGPPSGAFRMLTIEECKKHIGDLDLTDEQIGEIRDLLHTFVAQSLDYAIEQGMFVVKEPYVKKE